MTSGRQQLTSGTWNSPVGQLRQALQTLSLTSLQCSETYSPGPQPEQSVHSASWDFEQDCERNSSFWQ